jgi:hypothetical protein
MACRLWFAGDRSVDVVNVSIAVEASMLPVADP